MTEDEDADDPSDDDPIIKLLAERLSFAAMSVAARVTYSTIERRYRGQSVGAYWIELAKDILRDRESDEPELAKQVRASGEKPN